MIIWSPYTKIFAALLSLIVAPSYASGGDRIASIADSIIQPAMLEKQLPGLAVGIVHDGKVVLEKGYGVKSFESRQAPDENTVFYIGSLSKAITAVGIMLLVEQGKVNLDAPASVYLKRLPKTWQYITVKQFLAHQSGIPQLRQKRPTFAQMLRSADSVPLSFAPGTKQEYNNFNFAVAGKIIEAASGMNYLRFMKQRIFRPLHMNHTGSGIVSRNRATSYRRGPGYPNPNLIHTMAGPYAIPSGHLQSTVADLVKFDQALQSGKLLKPETYEQMVTRINPRFSGTPGWFERKVGKYSVVSKNGATQGFHSNMAFVPGKGDAVILLWTSQKPKGNDLVRVTNQLLNWICHVRMRGHVDVSAED